jgi:hypothetical protein
LEESRVNLNCLSTRTVEETPSIKTSWEDDFLSAEIIFSGDAAPEELEDDADPLEEADDEAEEV